MDAHFRGCFSKLFFAAENVPDDAEIIFKFLNKTRERCRFVSSSDCLSLSHLCFSQSRLSLFALKGLVQKLQFCHHLLNVKLL